MSYNQTHIPNVKTLAGGDEYIGFKDNLGNLIGVVGHENDTLVIRGTSDVSTPDKHVVVEGLTVVTGEGGEATNFVPIFKGDEPPTDTSLLWLEDSVDHVSLYSYDDRIDQWTGTERQYVFTTAHTITAGHDFEIGASEYRIPITHDAIPVRAQVVMETASAGALAIGGLNSGLIGDFILDGSSSALQGEVDMPAVITKGDSLYISLALGSDDVTNSVIILTMKNVG